MKKLISMLEIQETVDKGNNKIYIDEDTIVTPAALDSARESGIQMIRGNSQKENECANFAGVDINLITKLVMEALQQQTFGKSCDIGGLRLIRGNTVKCQPFTTGNPEAVVGLTDIVNTRESPHLGAGFMTIEKSSFEWTLDYEEFNFIVEGTLEIIVEGRKYVGLAGDVFFIPKGSTITWSSPDFVRFFYVTYPANWSGKS